VRARPSLVLRTQAGAATVREFLNPQFAAVEKPVADLLALLSDGTLPHIDSPSANDRELPYRMAFHGRMAAQNTSPRLDLSDITAACRPIGVQPVLRFESLLASGNPGDCALAWPARENVEMNVILRDTRDRAAAEGIAVGKAEGQAAGMTRIPRDLLASKFGPLPK
jgi:hypothetical protein